MIRPTLFLPVLFGALGALATAFAQTGAVQAIAPDVYFHEGDHALGHCNNGWIVFDNYVVVVDANYPSGAAVVLPKIRSASDKPLRFVIDTHFHPDHSFGNKFWSDAGAVAVAQVAALDELKKNGAAAWADSARTRPDVAGSQLQLPEITYSESMFFSDAHHRVELLWFGPGHTPGDTLVWLPKEKILFTGDVCVNGSYNYIHDSDTAGWVKVLEKARALGARIVCPGHGPIGGPEIIADQQGYLIELRREVQALVASGKTPAEVKAAVPEIAARLRKIPPIARYVPSDFWFTAHVEKVFLELGGQPLPR